MSLTICDFLDKYNLTDAQISSYDDDTKRIITEILNGKINNHINSKNGIILLYIGSQYEYIKKDIDLAKKYYLMGVEQECPRAINNMGLIYSRQNKLELAEKYYLMAIKYNNPTAMANLGALYEKQNKLVLAEKYYLMAIKYNNPLAMSRVEKVLKTVRITYIKIYYILYHI
jgi:tetratricopeptide (TPR) repeat protein